MKNFYLLIAILLFAGCSLKTNKNSAETESVESEQEEFVQQTDSCFVKNLKRFAVYKPCDDPKNEGIEYKYSDGRKLKILLFFEQTDVSARVIDENGRKERLDLDFEEVGYEGEGEGRCCLTNNEYVVGQYDFDGDDADELIIGVRSCGEDMNGVCLNVFRIKDGKRWVLSSGMSVLGEADCSIILNKVKIERHLRGFYYEWSFQNETFENTGVY